MILARDSVLLLSVRTSIFLVICGAGAWAYLGMSLSLHSIVGRFLRGPLWSLIFYWKNCSGNFGQPRTKGLRLGKEFLGWPVSFLFWGIGFFMGGFGKIVTPEVSWLIISISSLTWSRTSFLEATLNKTPAYLPWTLSSLTGAYYWSIFYLGSKTLFPGTLLIAALKYLALLTKNLFWTAPPMNLPSIFCFF